MRQIPPLSTENQVLTILRTTKDLLVFEETVAAVTLRVFLHSSFAILISQTRYLKAKLSSPAPTWPKTLLLQAQNKTNEKHKDSQSPKMHSQRESSFLEAVIRASPPPAATGQRRYQV